MKASNKIIEEVVGELLGEDAVNLALFVKGKSKVSEFAVAKHLKKDIHHARAILYKLFEANILVFERKKDRQKGWYITYWDFFPDNIMHIYKKIQASKLEKLKDRLKKEEASGYYMCKNACTRLDFDKASEFGYKCPECGEIMNPMDNKRTIEFINEKIDDLEKEVYPEE
jgi:transcription initiation factor TFIIE subunit alpha